MILKSIKEVMKFSTSYAVVLMLHNVLRICARFNGAYTLLCVWCGLDVLTLNLARTLFLFF